MEVFNRLNNTLIKNIDEIAVSSRQIEKPLKNTLKTFVKLGERTSTLIYGDKFTLEIGREYDNLSMLFIKTYVSTGGVDTEPQNMFGTLIYKNIRLSTRRGTNLQTIVPEYSQMRIGELFESQLYQKIADSVEIESPFVDGETSVITPLFLFCSEDSTTVINTRNYENLVLHFETQDDALDMGMLANLTSLRFELYGLFFDVNTSSSITDHLNSVKPQITRQIVGSYNLFFEDDISIVNGQRSARLTLRCPRPTFAIHAIIVGSRGTTKQIKKVKISFGGRTFLDLDYRMNYQFFGSPKGFIPDNSFSYFFSKEKNRSIDSGLITFSKEMSPCMIEYFFDSDNNYTLKTMCEYRTNYLVDERGYISLSDDVKMGEGQNQSNSVGLF